MTSTRLVDGIGLLPSSTIGLRQPGQIGLMREVGLSFLVGNTASLEETPRDDNRSRVIPLRLFPLLTFGWQFGFSLPHDSSGYRDPARITADIVPKETRAPLGHGRYCGRAGGMGETI